MKDLKNINVLISTLFGFGYLTKAPGTVGTAVAAIAYYFFPMSDDLINMYILLGYIILMSFISIYFITKAEVILGHDNGKIVIDEFFGYLVAVLFLPKTIWVILAAFALFRVFDILKPEPVNMLQKLPRGWGVMVDDLMAGLYANIILQIVFRIIIK